MIRKKVFAVLASTAAAAATIGVGGAAHAANDPTGHYHSSLFPPLHCTNVVLGHPDGGTLSAQYSAWETRHDFEHFRGAVAKTRVVAQVREYDGTWKTVKRNAVLTGTPGGSYAAGGNAVEPFLWGGSSKPTLSISVNGTDDLFRMQVRTRIYSDEGARLAYLRDSLGSCRI